MYIGQGTKDLCQPGEQVAEAAAFLHMCTDTTSDCRWVAKRFFGEAPAWQLQSASFRPALGYYGHSISPEPGRFGYRIGPAPRR